MTGRAVVVAQAHDIVEAQIWLDALNQAGIVARLFEQGPGAALGGAVTAGVAVYSIVVGEESFANARRVIGQLAGMEALNPLRDPDTDARASRSVLVGFGALVVAVMLSVLLWRLLAG